MVDEADGAELLAKRGNKLKYRACGIGATDNKGTLPKGVICTDVKLVPNDMCFNQQNPSIKYDVPDTFNCIQWPVMENNLCAGDFGGKL